MTKCINIKFKMKNFRHIKLISTYCSFIFLLITFTSCNKDDKYEPIAVVDNTAVLQVLNTYFGDTFGTTELPNYANQIVPNYITKDNSAGNVITDAKASLGRILFYDNNLSVNNTIACASCHKQSLAFGDNNDVSTGVNGTTGRHSMRLVNARFALESRFFWDKRAATLEAQTTQPIQDHTEMGFSGENGSLGINDLLDKLSSLEYYPPIFEAIYGDATITEARLQETLAQFVRSIQSFDSKFDAGLSQTNNVNTPFPNYTAQENIGKTLFNSPPNNNGAGCIGCHAAPEFDIDPNSRNNGVIGVFGDVTTTDLENTKAPTLRDIFNTQGQLNGALMHDASLATVEEVILHYNSIDPSNNPNLDNRLQGGPGQNGQQLNLSNDEIDALAAFIKTLSGTNLYTDPKWSNPFE